MLSSWRTLRRCEHFVLNCGFIQGKQDSRRSKGKDLGEDGGCADAEGRALRAQGQPTEAAWVDVADPGCVPITPEGEAHPPEDGRELHATPELRKVLEAHAVHLLEAAEQRLTVSLQARRGPHAFKIAGARGTGGGAHRSPHAHSGTGYPRCLEGPVAPPPTPHARAPRDVVSGTLSPAFIRVFPAPTALLAHA